MQELPKDPVLLIVKDEDLNSQDRWALARSCRRFYNFLRNDLMKDKIYRSQLIPMPLLDHHSFKKHSSNFVLLDEILKRFKRHAFRFGFKIPYFDYEEPWPLFALMGMEDALLECLRKDPEDSKSVDPFKKDCNGYTPLDYSVMSGNLPFVKKWIADHYKDFSVAVAPHLLMLSLDASGNEEMVKYFMDTWHYPTDFGIANPEINETFGFKVLQYGYRSLFWDIVNKDLPRYNHKNDLHGYPFNAIAFQHSPHWDLFEEIISDEIVDGEMIRQGFVANDESEFTIIALIPAAKDIKWFEHVLENDTKGDVETIEVFDEDIYSSACAGGEKNVVDLVIKKGFFELDYRRGEDNRHGIHIAALNGRVDLINHFIYEHKVDPLVTDNLGRTLFHYLIIHGDWDKFDALVKEHLEGFSGRMHGPDAFLTAVIHGHLYFLQRYIIGIDIEALNWHHYLGKKGVQSLQLAEKSGNPVMVKWIQQQIDNAAKMENCEKLYEATQSDFNSSTLKAITCK